MFFSFSKLGGFLVQPSNFLIIASLLGIILMRTRFRRGGQRILVGSVLVLAVCGFSPIGNWLLRPLEQRFPPWDEEYGAPDGIIVLGGVISHGTSAARPYPGINDAAERITVVSKLAKQFPNARLIYSGGSEANTAADLLELFRYLPIAHRGRAPIAQYHRKRILHEGYCRAEAGPTLAACYFCLSHAACHRGVSPTGLSRRGLSGRLASIRPRRRPYPVRVFGRRFAPDRSRFPRMVRPDRLSCRGEDIGAVSCPDRIARAWPAGCLGLDRSKIFSRTRPSGETTGIPGTVDSAFCELTY